MKKFPSESEIQRNILTLLGIKKIPCARINSGQIFTGKYRINLAPEGFPDILFFYRGRVHAVEVKKEGENLRPPQLEWKEILLKNGCSHLVAHSVEQVNEYLKVLDSRCPKALEREQEPPTD